MDFTGQKSSPYIADILYQHGIDHVVICPGSRSAPLTLSFARHGGFKSFTIVDERSAGYFALGLSLQLQKPVVIVTTSGTASLNLGPAIAEAYYQKVGLIAITADRPLAWIGQQDGQAIKQTGIFSNFVLKSYSLNAELNSHDDFWYTQRLVNEISANAIQFSQPVHLNYHTSEPLYNESFARVHANKIQMISTQIHHVEWSELLKNRKNIALVVGQMNLNEGLKQSIEKISHSNSVLVVAEDLSNLNSSSIVSNAAEAIHFVNESPDVIIYVGGPIVSKQFKQYVRQLDVHVIRIQHSMDWVDTFKGTTDIIHGNEIEVIESLANHTQLLATSSLVNDWKEASSKARMVKNEFVANIEFCDFKVFEFLAKRIPNNSVIHLGNSTPVRYAQFFNDLYAEGIVFQSNRGVSGIDGPTSTAIGYATLSAHTNFVITGDLSFQYDANAFFNNYVGGNLKVIIINNSGGNIFRIIDGSKDQNERGEFFEATVHHEFSNLAKHFKLNYFSAKNESECAEVWDNFIKHEHRPSILEIFTDAEINAKNFNRLNKNLQS